MDVFGITIKIVSERLYRKQIDYFGRRKSKVIPPEIKS